jgi:4-hydroxybenzoate polyprenyltransferase
MSLRRVARGIALLHPLPSALVSTAVAALATVAGAPRSEVVWLAVGMFGFQVSIGALNDIVDAERDRLVQPAKPIPAGIVSRRLAMVVVIVGAAAGVAISAWFGWPVLLVGLVGLGCGYAYDLVARRAGFGWLAFAIALPTLLVWAWLAAAGTLPPGWEWLLPLAALAGPALHLANSMADADADLGTDAVSLATRLGPRRARTTLVTLHVLIWTLAVLGLAMLGSASVGAWSALLVAMALSVAGVVLSVAPRTATSDLGWTLGAAALAVLAVVWAVAVGGT